MQSKPPTHLIYDWGKEIVAHNGLLPTLCTDLHPGSSCAWFKIDKAIKTLKVACGVYFFVQILPSLIFKFHRYRKNPKAEIKKTLISYIKSVLFLASTSAVPFMIYCNLSQYRGTSDFGTFLPCLISGDLGVLFEAPTRQKEIGLFLLPKVFIAVKN